MVNPSNLAAAAGSAAGLAAGTIAGADVGAASVRRALIRRTGAAAAARPSVRSQLVDHLLRRTLQAAGGGIMKAGARRVTVPGYAASAGASSRATSSVAPKAATSKSSTSKSSTSSSSSLSFLSDPKLSIEEKLMRLMAYLNDKYEKEMQTKMDEIAGKAPKASSSSKKSGGILGKVASAVSSVVGGDTLEAVSGFLKFPGVKTFLGHVAGPVLAAGASALGFPEAAPVLLKYGSKVVDAVADVASAATSSPPSSKATSGTSGTSSSSGTDGKNEQLTMMELQRLMDKQKEMFGLVSNILRAGHDTRMAVINNLR